MDVVAIPAGRVSWEWKHYEAIAIAFKNASKEQEVPITWGGDWRERDGTHFELDD